MIYVALDIDGPVQYMHDETGALCVFENEAAVLRFLAQHGVQAETIEQLQSDYALITLPFGPLTTEVSQ